MLKKDISFKDLDDNPVTETFYFNLTKIELIELDGETEGGIAGQVNAISQLEGDDGIVRGKDLLKVLNLFKVVLRKAYGKRSEDGRRLIKNDLVWEEFAGSQAFSELIETFFRDPGEGAKFINSMMPSDLVEAAQIEMAKANPNLHPPTASRAVPEPGALAAVPDQQPIQLTREQLIEIDQDELRSGLATGKYVIAPQDPAQL